MKRPRRRTVRLPGRIGAAASFPRLSPSDALLIVDVQNDFCPGGALPVPEGDDVVPVLNRWVEMAGRTGAKTIASRDWHPPNHISFHAQGGPWPAHCIAGSRGAEFHPELELPKRLRVISKGTKRDREEYSALGDPRVAQELKRLRVKRVWVGGLALDVCVRATVLDALKAGFEVHLIRDATRAVNIRPGDGRRALAALEKAGCIMEGGGRHGSALGAKSSGVGAVHRPLRADDGPGVRRREARSARGVRAGLSNASRAAKLPARRRSR